MPPWTVTLCQGMALAAVAAAVASDAAGPATALRHLYLLPTLWAAFTMGAAGGGLAGLLAGLLQAPVALPAVERFGLTSRTVDGLISLVAPLAFGWLVGRLVDEARARDARLCAVLEIGRILRREAPLEDGLAAVAERVRAALGAERVGLVVGSLPGDPAVAAAPVPVGLHPASAAALALSSGRPMSARDLEADPRVGASGPAAPSPVRGLVLPLDAGAGPLGALAIERSGDLPASARAAAEELAMHLALAVDNVRLTLRQRRSAEDLEDKVRAATERLRELDRAKSDFLSVVAHELRTPLTALEGFSELLLSRALPPERVTRFLGHLHGEARRLGRIVAELLDLSRIESGRPLQLRREELDLGELIERNVELFAAEHRGHRFEWLLDPAAPRLSADPDALDRILKNLLSNAVKYSPGGGRIAVSAGPAPDHPGMIELSVEDDGVGIPASHLPHIFERYVRVPDPRTAAARGLGLGLSLVRALAEGHGGRVEVESLPGKGSKFRLFLPG